MEKFQRVTYIVPWKNLVPSDFLEKFADISRSIFFERKRGMDPNAAVEINVLKPLGAEVKNKYIETRARMRKCGYELQEDTDVGRWRGWYTPYVDEGDELQFTTTASPGRCYCSLADFLSYKNLCERVDEKGHDVNKLVQNLVKQMATKYTHDHQDRWES